MLMVISIDRLETNQQLAGLLKAQVLLMAGWKSFTTYGPYSASINPFCHPPGAMAKQYEPPFHCATTPFFGAARFENVHVPGPTGVRGRNSDDRLIMTPRFASTPLRV